MKNTIKRSKKIIVVFVYSFRLVVAAFSIAMLASYLQYLDVGRESIGLAPTIAWQEVLMGFSLISASIPCLRTFVWAFYSREAGGRQFGINTSISFGSYYGSNALRGQLRSLTKTSSQAEATKTNASWHFSGFRPDLTEYRASIHGGRKKSNLAGEEWESTKSDESQAYIMGISRTVDFGVEEG